MNIIIFPSPDKDLNINERMFCNPIIHSNFKYVVDTEITTLNDYLNDSINKISSITILLDNYGTFIQNNIDFIISNKHIKFYIHENDIHYLASKRTAYNRYMLLRDKLINNTHVFILAYYWYHYPTLYKINLNNIICFPKFVFDKNIIKLNIDPINKVILSGSMSKQYPMRKYLKSLNHINIDILTHSDGIFGDEYYIYLNKYLCGFTCCSNKSTPYIINKFFEIPAAGLLLLAYDEYVKNPLMEIGFIDNENYISCTKENVIDKINYICDEKNRKEINRIRLNGYTLVKTNHTIINRFDTLFRLLNNK